MLRWTLIAFATVIAFGGAVYVIGLVLPRNHSAAIEGVIDKPASEIAATIRAVRDYASWRPGVIVQNLVEEDGAVTYDEIEGKERISYRLTESVRDGRFVTTMTDPNLPFGGSWTIVLTPEEAGTRVRIQEDGEIRDPLFRFFARFVFGYEASMKKYLRALATR